MYKILCDGFPLYDARDDELIVINPIVKLEVNTVGEGSFQIYKNHPHYGKLKKMKSIIEVSDEIGVIFRGRITNDTVDFYNGKAVDLEGAMAFFNDSVVRPYSFPEDYLEDEDYITASASGNVIEFFLNLLIENHNSQVQDFQKFKLGTVTVTDPNNYITRSSINYSKTWDVLKEKLFNSALGGFLCIRYEEDGNYIDYLSEFTLTNTQDISFSENLLDLKHDNDATATYSAIIPIGAEIEVENEVAYEDGSLNDYSIEKQTLTLESLPDGDITDDIVKKGDTLHSKSAVEEYGWICAPVEETTWSDVTEVNNLLTKGTNWLGTQGIMLKDSVEITAVDLHFTDDEIRSFRIYRKINVKSLPHGIDNSFDLTKLEIDILNPQNTIITVGETKLTLTDQNSKDQSDNIEKIEEVIKDIEENRTETTEIKNQIITNNTTMINTCEEIVLSALKSYVSTGNFDSFKETLETEFKLLSEGINIKVAKTIEQIENVNGDLQEKYNKITKYFTFDINGLTIGQVDNPNKIVIDNDEFSILVNDMVVQKFDANGKALIPELKITKVFDLFGYMIDQDENGNVNCEYVGGDS